MDVHNDSIGLGMRVKGQKHCFFCWGKVAAHVEASNVFASTFIGGEKRDVGSTREQGVRGKEAVDVRAFPNTKLAL